MEVLGFGIDLVDVRRVADLDTRHGARFSDRLFGPAEAATSDAWRCDNPVRLAVAFAVKEAVLKALGTGWGAGTALSDVEVRPSGSGVQVRLHGGACRRLADLGGSRIVASFSTAPGIAVAAAVVLAEVRTARAARSAPDRAGA